MSSGPSIQRLTFIYDADGSLAGEAKYWLGSLFGATHCALCDVTHTKVGKRPSFKACASRLGLPITYLHRDQLGAVLAVLTANQLPCVVGHCEENDVILLSKHELELLDGDVGRFETGLRDAIALHSASDGSDATVR